MRHRSTVTESVVRAHKRDWQVALLTAFLAAAALVAGSALGDVHGAAIRPRIVVWTAAVALAVFGVTATRRAAAAIGHIVATQTLLSAGAAVRLVASGAGYIVLIFAELGMLDVSVTHLLVGAGLAGVVLGIAAQQSLSNVFAAVVLLLARPFVVGDRIRIRSGALGGIFEATVTGITLTYITLQTDDGPLKIPNSVMLATAVGQVTPTVS
jgi:small-conductance mechanosensitive channel